MNSLARLYQLTANYSKAEPVFIESLNLIKSISGTEHPDYASALNNLAELYRDMGNYEKAEPLIIQSVAVFKATLGAKHPYYATALGNLARLYTLSGRYGDAEPLLIEALAIRKTQSGVQHLDYAISLIGLATLYQTIGNHAKAEPRYIEALAVVKNIFGTQHPDYASIANNLALFYANTGNYAKAEPLYLEALAIRKALSGTQNEDFAALMNNMGLFYYLMRSYAKAEQFYIDALAVWKTVAGTLHPGYASALNGLANVYNSMGEQSKQEALYVDALAIQKAVLGMQHPDYMLTLNNLATFYYSKGSYSKAEPLYLEARDILLRNIGKSLSFLSEEEKEKYLATVLVNFHVYQGFWSTYQAQKPSVAGNAYDIELATKGMVLSSGIAMKRSILASGSSEAVEQFEKWNAIKSTLARLYSLPVAERLLSTDSLENLATLYEKDLMRLSTTFNQARLLTATTWKDVQGKLKPGEVAIEFASFVVYNGKRWTDTMQYTALVLRKDDAFPTIINLCRQDQLDSLLNRKSSTGNSFIASLYRGGGVSSSDTSLTTRQKLYQLVWKPLESVLKTGDHIYFAPSGLLHQVAFAAIPAEDGKLLSDHHTFTQLSSTAMLLPPPPAIAASDLSVAAFGGIVYDAQPVQVLSLVPKNKQVNIIPRSFEPGANRGTSWNYLPGTLTEVNNIAALAKEYSITTTLYSGNTALEENYKSFGSGTSPKIIHIATHGFFFPDPEKEKRNKSILARDKEVFRTSGNPMNRSGLLFAGANRVWKGQPAAPALEDGILTAYEASQVNLAGTELVVLSACETGLGDIKGSEGVFGLQRAFKAAGAGYLMMSLWKVPDVETAEFMTEFYRSLFSGQTIETAFTVSQNAMKMKYRDDPYKWAAFVLVR